MEDGFLAGGEVFSNDPDDVNVGEVAGGEREVCGGAGEHALAAAGGSFNGIEGYACLLLQWTWDRLSIFAEFGSDRRGQPQRYLPKRSLRRSLVEAGMADG